MAFVTSATMMTLRLGVVHLRCAWPPEAHIPSSTKLLNILNYLKPLPTFAPNSHLSIISIPFPHFPSISIIFPTSLNISQVVGEHGYTSYRSAYHAFPHHDLSASGAKDAFRPPRRAAAGAHSRGARGRLAAAAADPRLRQVGGTGAE